MQDTNALFDNLLSAYRSADDPDRFLRELMMRLDDATVNAVVAAERKLDRLDAARARLDAARKVPRPDTSQDGASAEQPDDDEDLEPVEEAPAVDEAPTVEEAPKPKKAKAKVKAKAKRPASDAPKPARAPARAA